jgi:hypothetical protein
MVDPDIVLSEAVGSCTDLVSTVLRPLHAYHPDRYLVAPLTVLSDPLRDPDSFPAEVGYTSAFRDLAVKCRVWTVKSASDLGESGLSKSK